MNALEAAFEADLQTWVLRVYEQRAQLAKRGVETKVLRILESEKRWLVPLMFGVVVGVALVPVFGAGSLIGSLGLLYVGAFLSGYRTMRRAERVERRGKRRRDPSKAAQAAWEARPSLGPEEQVRLVRIMNLARAATAPSVRPVLLNELSEALAEPPLASWAFLYDLRDLLRADAAALAQWDRPQGSGRIVARHAV